MERINQNTKIFGGIAVCENVKIFTKNIVDYLVMCEKRINTHTHTLSRL